LRYSIFIDVCALFKEVCGKHYFNLELGKGIFGNAKASVSAKALFNNRDFGYTLGCSLWVQTLGSNSYLVKGSGPFRAFSVFPWSKLNNNFLIKIVVSPEKGSHYSRNNKKRFKIATQREILN
jgi:hypothetical protein